MVLPNYIIPSELESLLFNQKTTRHSVADKPDLVVLSAALERLNIEHTGIQHKAERLLHGQAGLLLPGTCTK